MTVLRTRDCAAGAYTPPEFERTGTGDEVVLVGGRCVDCGATLFPVRQRCTSCFGQRIEKASFPGEGRVVSFTIVRQAPSGYFGPVPYVVGNVALRDGVSALCPLAGKEVEAWHADDAVSAFALNVKVSDTANRDVLAFQPSTWPAKKEMTMHPSIIGVGMTKFGRYPDRSVESIAAEAICRALDDAGIEWTDVQQVYAAHVQQGVAAGQRVMREMGATGVPVLNVENCSAAGSTAVREAVNSLCAGANEVILIVGFEKMQPGLLLNVTPSEDPQVAMGLTVLPMRYSLLAVQHMANYGSKPEHFAQISVKNHAHAVHNPYAQYPKPMSLEEVMQSRMICDPITKLQCSPVTDGATAIVMASERFVAKHGRDRAVRILGSGLTSDRDLAVNNLHTTDVIERAAAAAYENAGLGPEDIDTAEVHDCFTVAEVVSYEALGFCPKGEGARLVEERSTWVGGKLPVNPGGGLLARGHPLGATGLAQMAEVVTQIRGEARGRQVEDANVGLTYNAGVMSACVTILGR